MPHRLLHRLIALLLLAVLPLQGLASISGGLATVAGIERSGVLRSTAADHDRPVAHHRHGVHDQPLAHRLHSVQNPDSADLGSFDHAGIVDGVRQQARTHCDRGGADLSGAECADGSSSHVWCEVCVLACTAASLPSMSALLLTAAERSVPTVSPSDLYPDDPPAVPERPPRRFAHFVR